MEFDETDLNFNLVEIIMEDIYNDQWSTRIQFKTRHHKIEVN